MAAHQGYSEGQTRLAFMYSHGKGVTQDFNKALEWYTKAANQGNIRAQYNLAIICDNGRGVPQDYFKAVEWYTKAADQGDSKAQYNLGIIYENGVLRNQVKSKEYYKQARLNKTQDGCDAF